MSIRPALVALSLSLVPAAAAAQSPPARTPPAPTPVAPTPPAQAPATGAPARVTPFQAAMQRGVTAFQQSGWDAASTAFREAASADPRSALPALSLAYVARARDDAATAMAQCREAQRIATAEGDDLLRGRAMQCVAELEERAGRWDEARAAWQGYTVFADGHASATFPAVGRSRIEAIGRRTTLAQEYAPVRQRIAERLARNASGADQQPPPPALPPSAIAPGRR